MMIAGSVPFVLIAGVAAAALEEAERTLGATQTRDTERSSGAWTAAEYRRRRDSDCEWKPMPVGPRARFSSIEAYDLPQQDWAMGTSYGTDHRNGTIYVCTIAADGADGRATLFIVRMGTPDGAPVSMAPGGWQYWMLPLRFPEALADSHNVIRASQWHSWPVFEDGSDVPWPPMQNHHALFMGLGSAKKALTSWIPSSSPLIPADKLVRFKADYESGIGLTGGDSMCLDEAGGADCIFRTVPLHYAFSLPAEAGLSIVVRDVRPRVSPMHLYKIWYEVGFRVLQPQQPTPVRDVYRVSIFMNPSEYWTPQGPRNASTGRKPMSATARRTRPTHTAPAARRAVERGINTTMYATFALPVGRCSLYTKEVAIPAAGQVVSESWHGHHAFTNEGVVFSGSIAKLLARLGYAHAQERPELLTDSVENTKQALRALTRSANVTELCRYVPKRASVAPGKGMEQQLYDRSMRPTTGKCSLQGHSVRAGEVFSVLCFNCAPDDVVALQHCDAYLHFSPAAMPSAMSSRTTDDT